MRSPRHFFEPLAVGAPTPLREVPFRPSRMIHFFDPSNAKMVAKLPGLDSLRAQLLGLLSQPGTGLVRVLNAVPQSVLNLLQAKVRAAGGE